jgi:hypothetical protein
MALRACFRAGFFVPTDFHLMRHSLSLFENLFFERLARRTFIPGSGRHMRKASRPLPPTHLASSKHPRKKGRNGKKRSFLNGLTRNKGR